MTNTLPTEFHVRARASPGRRPAYAISPYAGRDLAMFTADEVDVNAE